MNKIKNYWSVKMRYYLLLCLIVLFIYCAGPYANYTDNVGDPWDNIPITENEYVGQEYDILGPLALVYEINETAISGEGVRPSYTQVADELKKQAWGKFGKQCTMIAKYKTQESGILYNNNLNYSGTLYVTATAIHTIGHFRNVQNIENTSSDALSSNSDIIGDIFNVKGKSRLIKIEKIVQKYLLIKKSNDTQYNIGDKFNIVRVTNLDDSISIDTIALAKVIQIKGENVALSFEVIVDNENVLIGDKLYYK